MLVFVAILSFSGLVWGQKFELIGNSTWKQHSWMSHPLLSGFAGLQALLTACRALLCGSAPSIPAWQLLSLNQVSHLLSIGLTTFLQSVTFQLPSYTLLVQASHSLLSMLLFSHNSIYMLDIILHQEVVTFLILFVVAQYSTDITLFMCLHSTQSSSDPIPFFSLFLSPPPTSSSLEQKAQGNMSWVHWPRGGFYYIYSAQELMLCCWPQERKTGCGGVSLLLECPGEQVAADWLLHQVNVT